MALLIRRAIIIANPASRRGNRLAQGALRMILNRSIECDLVFTQHPGHATELALHHAPQYDAVFALGGDGTVMEVAGAMAGSLTPVGVLAGGTGNLLARALGIPLSLRRAVPALLAGDELAIDLGRLDSGRRFAIAAGVGVDATMVAETPRWLKRRLGVVAYTIIGTQAAMRAVIRDELFDARVTVDGTVYEHRTAAIMVANFGEVLGRRITLGPEIRTNDGLLDTCVFSPRTMWDALQITWSMLRGDFRTNPCMCYYRGRTIHLETSPPRQWQADGELMGMTPFSVTVEPRAVRLLVPARRSGST